MDATRHRQVYPVKQGVQRSMCKLIMPPDGRENQFMALHYPKNGNQSDEIFAADMGLSKNGRQVTGVSLLTMTMNLDG